MSQIMSAKEFPMPDAAHLTNYFKEAPWKEHVRQMELLKNEFSSADDFERARKKRENLLSEEFYEPRDNVPSMTADADYKYKKMLKDYNKRFEQDEKYLGY